MARVKRGMVPEHFPYNAGMGSVAGPMELVAVTSAQPDVVALVNELSSLKLRVEQIEKQLLAVVSHGNATTVVQPQGLQAAPQRAVMPAVTDTPGAVQQLEKTPPSRNSLDDLPPGKSPGRHSNSSPVHPPTTAVSRHRGRLNLGEGGECNHAGLLLYKVGQDVPMEATRVVMHQIVPPAECDLLGICFGGQVWPWQAGPRWVHMP